MNATQVKTKQIKPPTTTQQLNKLLRDAGANPINWGTTPGTLSIEILFRNLEHNHYELVAIGGKNIAIVVKSFEVCVVSELDGERVCLHKTHTTKHDRRDRITFERKTGDRFEICVCDRINALLGTNIVGSHIKPTSQIDTERQSTRFPGMTEHYRPVCYEVTIPVEIMQPTGYTCRVSKVIGYIWEPIKQSS